MPAWPETGPQIVDQRLQLQGCDRPGVRHSSPGIPHWESGPHGSCAALGRLLADRDLTVERRACEAFVRSGIEPPVEPLLTLLASEDRWLRFAARVALERVPQDKWYLEALASRHLHIVTEALLAGYRHDRKGSAKTILEHT